MKGRKQINTSWTDASLHYYHKNTLKCLLELDIVQYQEEPHDSVCIIEPTSLFTDLIKNSQKENDQKILPLEGIFQDLAKNRRIKLQKNLMYDMLKLICFDFAQTSLYYYHKRTLDCLLDLDIIHYLERPNGVSCSAEKTPYFQKLMEDNGKGYNSKMAALDHIFKILTRKKEMKINKKLRYDMIKLMNYIDKFGGNRKIWIKKG